MIYELKLTFSQSLVAIAFLFCVTRLVCCALEQFVRLLKLFRPCPCKHP